MDLDAHNRVPSCKQASHTLSSKHTFSVKEIKLCQEEIEQDRWGKAPEPAVERDTATELPLQGPSVRPDVAAWADEDAEAEEDEDGETCFTPPA